MTEPPKATYLEDEYVFVWESLDVRMTLERFREERGELKVDCQPQSASTPDAVLPAEKINLSSARSLKQYANTLSGSGMLESDQWMELLTQACELAKRRYREGSPSVRLADVEYHERARFVIRPYIEARGTTIWFGDGGVSKSIHALAACLSVATGLEVLPGGVPRVIGPTLYLDWEADEETHAERMAALCAAMEINPPPNVFYMRRSASVGESVRELRRLIAMEGIVFGVVDSIGAAAGGDPEKAEPIIRAMNGIRALEVPMLAIHHVTKDQKDKSKPFGSVYSPNLARLTWRLDKEQDEGAELVRVRLTNFKGNNVRLLESKGHGIRFTNVFVGEDEILEEVAFTQVSGLALPAMNKRGTVKLEIARVLRETAGLSLDQITDETGFKRDTVYRTLSRGRESFQEHDGKWFNTDGRTGSLSVSDPSVTDGRTYPPLIEGGVRVDPSQELGEANALPY